MTRKNIKKIHFQSEYLNKGNDDQLIMHTKKAKMSSGIEYFVSKEGCDMILTRLDTLHKWARSRKIGKVSGRLLSTCCHFYGSFLAGSVMSSMLSWGTGSPRTPAPSMLMLPYVTGTSEDIRWVCGKYGLRAISKSGRSLWSVLSKVSACGTYLM